MAMHCAVLCYGSVLVYHMFVLSYIHILFIIIYFTFSSCTFFFIQFRSCYLHNTHHPCTTGLPMYVFFLSFIHSMNAMFICNRNHSRLMLYFANRLCWAQNFHIWLIFTWNRPNDWLSSIWGLLPKRMQSMRLKVFSILIKFSKFKC